MGCFRPGLAVAPLVNHKHPFGVGGCQRLLQQQFQPALIEGVRVPGRLREEPLEALHTGGVDADIGVAIAKGCQSLGSLGREQQPFKLAAKPLALIPLRKLGVEVLSIGLKRFWCRCDW